MTFRFQRERPRRQPSRPLVEQLEDRRLMSGTVVAPTNPGGPVPVRPPPGTPGTLAGPPGLAGQVPPASSAPPFAISGVAGVPIQSTHVWWEAGWAVDHFTVDWGDGSAPSAGVVTPIGNGASWFDGSHTYAAAGTYTVTINVYTSAAATTPWATDVAATVTIEAASRRLSVAKRPAPVTAPVQGEWSTTLPSADSGQTPSVVIHWGDGTKPDRSGTVWTSNGRAYVVASHTYRHPGKHRAIAVFSVNGKVVARVAEVLKVQRAST